MKARLEKDRKFWEVETDSGTGEVRIRFGRIGTNGQLHTIPGRLGKPVDEEATRRLNAKIREGYTIVNTTEPIQDFPEDRSLEKGVAISITKEQAAKLTDADMSRLAKTLGLHRDQHGSITDQREEEGLFSLKPLVGGWAKDLASAMGTLLAAIAWKSGTKVANMDENEEQSPAVLMKALPRERYNELVAIGFAPEAMQIDVTQPTHNATGWSMTVL